MIAKLDCVNLVAGIAPPGEIINKSSKAKPSTYADVVATNLSSIVTLTVISTLKQQRREDRSKASIVLYGVVDDRNDTIYIRKILSSSIATCKYLEVLDGAALLLPLQLVYQDHGLSKFS